MSKKTPEADSAEGALNDKHEEDPLGLFNEDGENLTMKQRLFAQTYVDNGGNATQAAIKAGYKEDQAHIRGSENIRKSKVKAEIQRCYNLRTSASGATADYALSKLKDNLEAASMAEKFSDVNKAAELIGKYHKLFTDKLEHSGQVDSNLTETTPEMTLEEATRVYEENIRQPQ